MTQTTELAFEDIQAEAPDMQAVRAAYADLAQAYDAAEDAAGRSAVIERWDALRREVETWSSLVGLRFRQDTRDPERKAALELHDELEPKLQELENGLKRSLGTGPHADELAARFGPHLLASWQCQIESYDPAIEVDVVAESRLKAAYTELVSSARFDFRGEALNLSQLGKYAQHADREVRHEAAKLRYAWFGANAAELDRIYHELVANRHGQARKLGYDSYVALGYKKLGRTDYGAEDVARYRRAILEHVVPLCAELRERQRQRLGVDRLMAWDEAVHDPQGNPAPKGGHDWMVERARAMFDEMGNGLGRFFARMAGGGFIDLRAREGKAGGGFCTSFPSVGMPFIFANFNGTKGDVDVFTHEMGHAFQNWSSRDKDVLDYRWPTAEAAEVHSMSLEFLCWPHMEKFFEDDADRYREGHLIGSLLFLPYGVAVDHFQHWVYEHPEATPAERLATWREMERTYLPHRDWGDVERAAAGGMWQNQLHVYQYPFYYIDYTLAGVCAMQFWVRAEQDREAAMRDYVALCRRGGEAPFQDLVRSAGLVSPFDDGCLQGVVAAARRTLGL